MSTSYINYIIIVLSATSVYGYVTKYDLSKNFEGVGIDHALLQKMRNKKHNSEMS